MSPIYNLRLECPYYKRNWFKVLELLFKNIFDKKEDTEELEASDNIRYENREC
jgi:hypothetical protein